jgi:Family of unknown function (DUF6049)
VRRRLLALIAALSAPAVLTVGAVGGPVARVAAAPLPLQIVAQDFTVAANGVLTLTIRLPEMDPATAGAADVVVTAYRRVETRLAVDLAMAGMLPQALDVVDTPLSLTLPAGAGEITLAMPIETNTRTPGGLQLSNAGLYPVAVDVRAGGDPLAEVITFVSRLEVDPPQPYVTLPVTAAMSVTEPVAIDATGAVVLDDGDVAQYRALAIAMEASAVPVTARVAPRVLTALRSIDAALADRLTNQLVRSTVVGEPDPPLDPTSAADVGLVELYEAWRDDGDAVLAGELATAHPVREWGFVDERTSAAGAGLMSTSGTTTLLIPAAMVDAVRPPGADPTVLATVRSGASTINALTADPRLSELLIRTQSTPRQTAIYAAADLLAARSEILAGGGDPSRHGVLLGVGNLGIPWSTALAAVTELIVQTPQLAPTTIGAMVATMQRGSAVVQLSGTPTVELESRLVEMLGLTTDSTAVASMLPADDARPGQWERSIALMPSTGLTGTQVAGMAEAIRAEQTAVRDAVEVPEPFTFTLTGRRSTIRLNFQNTSSTPLTVLVRMSSPKLAFPEGEQLVVLAANTSTQVAVPVEARASGDFGVALDVFTPEGEQRLAPTVPLTASLTAISGLGNLITGVALLLLATWWVRHFLHQRRTRQSAAVRVRHPSAQTAEPTHTETDGSSGGTSEASPRSMSEATPAVTPDDDALDREATEPAEAPAGSTLPPS